MPQGYDDPRHLPPTWIWKPDTAWGQGGGYYELDGTNPDSDPTGRHSYECVQYTLGKIHGRPPRQTDTDDFAILLVELQRLGYHQHDCAGCGCGDDQCTDCVVIYCRNGAPFHVAVFDRTLCDWGGKLRATQALVRFKAPRDYLRNTDTMICYCREPAGPYISDSALDAGAMPLWVEKLLDYVRRIWRALQRLFGGF